MKRFGRLVRSGNSTQVTIPTDVLRHLGWRPGAPIILELTERNSLEVRLPELADMRTPGQPMVLDATQSEQTA